jgi:predicted RNase H-like nuclease
MNAAKNCRLARITGVDGCKAGWIAVTTSPEAFETAEVRTFVNFVELLAELAPRSIIAIDMPIGLPERAVKGGREADRAAREFLGTRRASVFPVPSRRAVYACEDGYREVCSVAQDTSDPPRAVSIQLFGILPRIQQIDKILRQEPALRKRIFEVHPEVSFKVMSNNWPLPTKKGDQGLQLRRELLHNEGFAATFLHEKPPRGAEWEDFYDACACVWSAKRILDGVATVFPSHPPIDGEGLEQAIQA